MWSQIAAFCIDLEAIFVFYDEATSAVRTGCAEYTAPMEKIKGRSEEKKKEKMQNKRKTQNIMVEHAPTKRPP